MKTSMHGLREPILFKKLIFALKEESAKETLSHAQAAVENDNASIAELRTLRTKLQKQIDFLQAEERNATSTDCMIL